MTNACRIFRPLSSLCLPGRPGWITGQAEFVDENNVAAGFDLTKEYTVNIIRQGESVPTDDFRLRYTTHLTVNAQGVPSRWCSEVSAAANLP